MDGSSIRRPAMRRFAAASKRCARGDTNGAASKCWADRAMSGFSTYVARRLLLLVFVVWAILTIIFILFKLLPGDPTAIFVDSNFSVEMIDRQKALWGLNDPLWLQYVRYLRNMALFDFGESFFQNQPVAAILSERTANTALMIGPALIISVVAGTLIGAIAGCKRGSRFEKATG